MLAGHFFHHDDDEAKLRLILKDQRTYAKVWVFHLIEMIAVL
jgi:hypothetical protein